MIGVELTKAAHYLHTCDRLSRAADPKCPGCVGQHYDEEAAKRWRVGRKLRRTLYQGENFEGLLESEATAQLVVDCLNGNVAQAAYDRGRRNAVKALVAAAEALDAAGDRLGEVYADMAHEAADKAREAAELHGQDKEGAMPK